MSASMPGPSDSPIGLVELLARLGVLDRQVERALAHPDDHERQADALEVEGIHHHAHALVLLATRFSAGIPAVLKDDLGGLAARKPILVSFCGS